MSGGWTPTEVVAAITQRGPLYVWRAANDPDIATVWTSRLTNGEPANHPAPDGPAREPAGHSTTSGGIRDNPAGDVLQPVADSPHDPEPATERRPRLDVTAELIEAIRSGRLRIVDRKPYFVNGRHLVDTTFEWVDP